MGKGWGNVGTIDCGPCVAYALLFTARALLKRFILFRWAVTVALRAIGIVVVFQYSSRFDPHGRGIAWAGGNITK